MEVASPLVGEREPRPFQENDLHEVCKVEEIVLQCWVGDEDGSGFSATLFTEDDQRLLRLKGESGALQVETLPLAPPEGTE